MTDAVVRWLFVLVFVGPFAGFVAGFACAIRVLYWAEETAEMQHLASVRRVEDGP